MSTDITRDRVCEELSRIGEKLTVEEAYDLMAHAIAIEERIKK